MRFLPKTNASTPEGGEKFKPETVKTGLLRLAAAVQQKSPPFLLMIDDDDHDSFFFQNALKQAGLSVQFLRLKGGEQAIDYFEGKGRFADRIQFPLPHLTLLDFRMPGMSGVEVLEYMRAHPDTAKAIIIAFTASQEPSDLEAASRLRVNAYIVKPSKVTNLIEIIRHLKLFWLDTVSAT